MELYIKKNIFYNINHIIKYFINNKDKSIINS